MIMRVGKACAKFILSVVEGLSRSVTVRREQLPVGIVAIVVSRLSQVLTLSCLICSLHSQDRS